jgi:hypothetical protein
MTDTLLAVGQVCTAEGHVQLKDTLDRVAEIAWCPAINYRRSQPLSHVTVEHDETWVVGRTISYERSRHWGLLAAMTLRADHQDLLSDGPWFLSPRLHTVAPNPMRWERAEILDLSITRKPANTQTRPLRFAALDAALSPRGLPWGWEDTWARAKDLAGMGRYRSAPKCLEINDLDELSIPELMATDQAAGRRALDAALAKSRAAATPRHASTGRTYRHSLGGAVIAYDPEPAA